MKKIISLILLICITGSFFGCKQKNTAPQPSNPLEDYLRIGMYYQQLGEKSYDPKIGIYFKDVDKFAQKNYENANDFDDWVKSNDSGLYTVMPSDMEEYDFRLELDNHVDVKDLVFYVKSIDGKDKLELYEYTPDAEFTMCSYGTYLSEKYIKDNGYTEFDWNVLNEESDKESENDDVIDTTDYKKHLGTWYYTCYSDPDPDDFKPLTITDKGNNKAEIAWYDGTIEQITFISNNIAHGDTSICEYCAVETPSGLSEERKNVPIVNVYDFTPINGEESMLVCQRTTDTDRLVIAEWQNAVRNVDDVFSYTHTSTTPILSEDEAADALESWLGDLGTWVAGENNVLVCNGRYKCNNKEYYQFALKGFVYDHYSTLTWYVISVDGSEMFEGQCNNGYLNKF